jgi:V8-like Glu-specific endopeptidase
MQLFIRRQEFVLRGRVNLAHLAILCLAAIMILMPCSAFAQPGAVSKWMSPATEAQIQAATAYWTYDRMRSAIPVPLHVSTLGSEAHSSRDLERAPDAYPGFVPGWAPGRAPQPASNLQFEVTPNGALRGLPIADVEPQTGPPFSPPSSPTDYGNYAPFQRFTWGGGLTQYPVSTLGKLFFTQRGQDFVCSASVINKNTIATAGHCVHDGSNSDAGWSSNLLFCPSYSPSGINPSWGCWGWVYESTSLQWFSSGATDRDYACVVTAPTGTIVANNIGNATGWTGRAWNLPSRQATFVWGYPAASPFPGNSLIVDVSTEWYEVDMTSGDGQVSKYIGNDMTGGSSGGPWWLNMRSSLKEYADTDRSSVTDPSQGDVVLLLTGVNSRKRCTQSGCPSGSVFTQEMGSPQFRNTTGDNNQSEDVFAVCFTNGES